MVGPHARTADTSGRRALRLLLGSAAVYFLLSVADLALYEQMVGAFAETPEPVRAGVVSVPVAERVRGGHFDPDLGVPVFQEREASVPGREGELARALARLKGEVTDVVEGRRMAGCSFVSVQDVAGFLDAELHQASAGAPATLISSAGIVVITPDDKVAQRNYQRVALDEAPRVIEERLHLPIKALRSLWEASVRWDERRRRFELKLGDRRQSVAMPEDLFKLEVDRSDRLLKVYYAERLAVTWSLCVGRGDNTPVGAFHIQNKGVWPGWRAYWGEFIPGGSRRNPLGARWLGTTARGRTTGRIIGIHGTNQPSSIGRRISGGCMRLTNAHAIELYNTIPIGTRVVIHE